MLDDVQMRKRRRTGRILNGLILLIIAFLAYYGFQLATDLRSPASRGLLDWQNGDPATRSALVTVQREACPNAPFILPADGFIGLLYGDPRGPYSTAAPHQGIDIFSNTDPGLTPVYAAYDGYITRESDWRSTLIQRVPDDPLNPGAQIWLYYTHMADREGNDFIEEAFPPGTSELFVEQGTLLGYTGDYNGDSLRPVWVHLHFSIVKEDGNGRYLNELDFTNTLDPSPYFGMSLNHSCGPATTDCTPNLVCQS
jgi:murein DD-endopeptidase MepM/ murein hydrolase activator NlpD